jgi:ADP-glucose type glycogen/starch synthase
MVSGPPDSNSNHVTKMNDEAAENRQPRILLVTPEVSYLPESMGDAAHWVSVKAGGLADVSAALISALVKLGADVHVALPNYRLLFHGDIFHLHETELRKYHEVLPDTRIHLAQDRIFYYRQQVNGATHDETMRIALAFQREVINHIIPRVRPDLIHCNDWMTGLIPAMARRRAIKSLFTMHSIYTRMVPLTWVEDDGIDAAEFWQNLYFDALPGGGYEFVRNKLSIDLLASGIFGAHYINTVSPRFLREVVAGEHPMIADSVRSEIRNKFAEGCATGILNAPDSSYNPAADRMLAQTYGPNDFAAGKAANKHELQQRLGLDINPDAPVFFWPSRLDPLQKGPQLLAEILRGMVDDYRDRGLQVVLVANGVYQDVLRRIVVEGDLYKRVAVVNFEEQLSRLAYAGSDFMLMPSMFEPCGLPQMIAPIYGTLAVARGTGGIADTVRHLDVDASTGNGFRFEHYDSTGLRWAVDQAMAFFALPREIREREVRRIMQESKVEFSYEAAARNYMKLYEAMLARPLVEECVTV